MRSGRVPRVSRLVLVLAVLLLGLPLAAPAAADDLFVGCSWVGSQEQDERVCGEDVFDFAGTVTRWTCWRYRPSAGSFVQLWVDGAWYRQYENVGVRVRRNPAVCGARYPYQTFVSVPVFADQVGRAMSYRLVMPRTAQYGRTYWPLTACALPAYSEGWCE